MEKEFEDRKHSIDENKYQRIHYWLRNKYGKADRCESSDCQGHSSYYCWALKRGCFYKKSRNSFWMLCKSCHTKYDLTERGKQRIIKALTGRPVSNETREKMGRNKRKAVVQLDKNGMIVNKWRSLTDCAREFNTLPSDIYHIISGRNKAKQLNLDYAYKYE